MIKINNNYFFSYALFFVCYFALNAMEIEQKQQPFLQVPSKLQPLFDDLSLALDFETMEELLDCIKLQKAGVQCQKEKGPGYAEQLCSISKLLRTLEQKRQGEQKFSWKELVNIVKVIKSTDKTKCILTKCRKEHNEKFQFLSGCCDVDRIIDATNMINTWQYFIIIGHLEKQILIEKYEKPAILAIGNPKNLKPSDEEPLLSQPIRTAFKESFNLLNIPYEDHFKGDGIIVDENHKQAYENVFAAVIMNTFWNTGKRKNNTPPVLFNVG